MRNFLLTNGQLGRKRIGWVTDLLGVVQWNSSKGSPHSGAGADPSNIVDSAYPYGSIQVPAGQEPIVLHRDAVSAGGYFQIGTVISADMDLIGQLQPNKKVQFIKVSMDEALKARSVYQAKMAQVRETLNR